ncbi:hypothetical protein MRX96_005213 [Rhipicephalus microplus]
MSIDRSWPLRVAYLTLSEPYSEQSRKRASHRRRSLAPRAETHFWEGGREPFPAFEGGASAARGRCVLHSTLNVNIGGTPCFQCLFPSHCCRCWSGFAHEHLSAAAMALLSACQFTDARPQI